MAADLHIHVVEDEETEQHVRESFLKTCSTNSFSEDGSFQNVRQVVIDDKGVEYVFLQDDIPEGTKIVDQGAYILNYDEKKVEETPNIWIGEVSWLKADLFKDKEMFIPNTVANISELIGQELPTITDEFIEKVMNAFELVNNTKREGGVWDGEGYSLANPDDVKEFLERYKGKKVFTISW